MFKVCVFYTCYDFWMMLNGILVLFPPVVNKGSEGWNVSCWGRNTIYRLAGMKGWNCIPARKMPTGQIDHCFMVWNYWTNFTMISFILSPSLYLKNGGGLADSNYLILNY